ncbi:hypothetical protein [Halobacillus naozhouensis]|uniref:Uncharacterized protein n=1 Tax=Halobacillus naozhouensis TaxID=554880 RepID=A0ABY8J152_9BACI|nr:hypothetical protein [Halobacillus naozhouensis]WFT76228.1 hypothetical protein P9989_07655 [Halobacillus naozhouensis]
MTTGTNDQLQNLMLFFPYLKKGEVIRKLTFIQRFPDFNEVYTKIRKDNEQNETSLLVAKTLNQGLREEKIKVEEIDELLFLLLEDSLFNSYIFPLEHRNLNIETPEKVNQLLSSWELPEKNELLSNVKKKGYHKDFIMCGYRTQSSSKTDRNIDSIRMLILDRAPVNLSDKNGDTKESVYPTIIEVDFARDLLHIRLKDVDNIINAEDKIRTMSGRIENTLHFIDSFQPHIHYSKFESFRSSLYKMEENLLQEKRDQALSKLRDFDEQIIDFSNKVTEKFNPPSDNDISVKTYISNGVLSIIATTLNDNEIGDVVGIKFRNNQENDNDKKYAEITISDKGYNCISTNNLYWLNLPVLHNRKMVEFLKITKSFESGAVVANLEFSIDTANIRLLQRTTNAEHKKPTQEKYDDLINYLKEFL